MRQVLFILALSMTLSTALYNSAYAFQDRESFFLSDSYRDAQIREQAHADRLNREDRQRTEDYHRQLERDRQDRLREESQRSYSRQDRDGRIETCSATRYSTVCN